MNTDVCDVIISGVAQPQEGRVVLMPQLANPSGYQVINPPVNKGLTVDEFVTKLDGRFDNPRYYTGDSAS
jgi:hypothetical protein